MLLLTLTSTLPLGCGAQANSFCGMQQFEASKNQHVNPMLISCDSVNEVPGGVTSTAHPPQMGPPRVL